VAGPLTPGRDDPAGLDLAGTSIGPVLRDGGKSVVTLGRHDGHPVVVKVLTSDDPFWRARFAHEIAVLRALAAHPAPVRTPGLVHTDGSRVLVVEHLPGRPLDRERYPTGPLPPGRIEDVLAALDGFAAWSPPGGLAPVFDYAARLARSHRDGTIDDRTHTVLQDLVARLGRPGRTAHGDPLPSNLLIGPTALVDFEFTGTTLPGFDLAVLHTLLVDVPGAPARIRSRVAPADEPAFLLNRALVLTRELRMHRGKERLPALTAQWGALLSELPGPGHR